MGLMIGPPVGGILYGHDNLGRSMPFLVRCRGQLTNGTHPRCPVWLASPVAVAVCPAATRSRADACPHVLPTTALFAAAGRGVLASAVPPSLLCPPAAKSGAHTGAPHKSASPLRRTAGSRRGCWPVPSLARGGGLLGPPRCPLSPAIFTSLVDRSTGR